MRLQHVAVMFVIIFIPIILVISYFISLQVDTIKLEADYDEKLLKATYDAMASFELNTANEDLSSVADSLRSIIEASNNIFFNTLCTNLGVSNASKSYVQPFIPAILYTLYDGYYIYSPTNTPEICVDDFGRTIRTSDYGVKFLRKENGIGFYEFDKSKIQYGDEKKGEVKTEPIGFKDGYNVDYNELSGNGLGQEYGQILYKNKSDDDKITYSTELHTFGDDSDTFYKRTYILKSYIPYSARYSGNNGGPSGNQNYDITINYTLDNFMTVEGKVGGIYYTKSGYLIRKDLVKSIIYNDNQITNWYDISVDDLDKYIHDPDNYEVIVKFNDDTEISNKEGYVKVTLDNSGASEEIYWDDAQSAVEYYVDSWIFSSWFYDNFKNIKGSDLKNTGYSVTDIQNAASKIDISSQDNQTKLYKDMLYDFALDSDIYPFSDDSEKNDPENGESAFYRHKRNVIKNSITYNLILTMLVYTEESKTVEFNMPVFKETEWDSILNNVSIVTFMEGMRCGLKYYNNYAIVTSTNNEISVTDNEIYYVPRVLEEVRQSNGEIAQILSNLEDDDKTYSEYPFSGVVSDVLETAHRIDCEDLILGGNDNFQDSRWLGCISFKSKEIKYDKILEKDGSYTYDHKAYTDYDCIVDSNYKVKNFNGSEEDGNTNVLEYLNKNKNKNSSDNNFQWKLKAYRIAIAKERNNLYKSTAFPENYGWQVFDCSDQQLKNTQYFMISNVLNGISTNKIPELNKIEITGCLNDDVSSNIGNVKLCYKDSGRNYITFASQSFSTASKNDVTLELKFDSNNIKEKELYVNSDQNFTLKSIKIYYK